ncbi:hypothetical protein WME79_12550 [Sorangium sp. So ce726]|uniref:hypothetical protein n=1 Tax=Sorangium sp. So ce726 TaxID=3133319 RepID=UPI003F5E751E
MTITDTAPPGPKREALDGPVRDFLIDIAHRHYSLPPLHFAKIRGGTWDRFSLAGYVGTLTVADSSLKLVVDAYDCEFNELYEMLELRNRPIVLQLQDGTEVHAEIGHMKSLGANADISVHHWIWTAPTAPFVWAGRLVGKIPMFGNLTLREHGDRDRWFVNREGFRFAGRYVWYILPKVADNYAIAVVDASGDSLSRDALLNDFGALQFTLGGGLRLDYLTGVDRARNVAGAMSLGSLERPRTSYRPPVAHELTETNVWMPEFFRLLAAKLSTDSHEALTVAITSYLDAESDHVDGAYLKAQVGLEAFARRIVNETSPELLVKDKLDWKRWISELEPTIRAHLLDPKSISVVKGKIIGAMYAPSGDLVRKALELYGISPPDYVLEEIKNRNYPAHGFLMNKTLDYDIDRDARRLEMIQTVLVALVACHIGYGGPIHGYDVADNGGRLLPTWWPMRSHREDVWVHYVGKRHVAGPPPQELCGAAGAAKPEREQAIRERAYFLWKTRTGSSWWDPTSNWLEAENAEPTRDNEGQT